MRSDYENTVVQKSPLVSILAHMMTAFVVFISIISSSTVFAYKVETHVEITRQAITKSNINYRIKQLGLQDGIKHNIKGFKKKSIEEWMKYGSGYEDEVGMSWIPPISEKGALYNHFYYPIHNFGYYEQKEGVVNIIGQSLLSRMNDYIRDENDFNENTIIGQHDLSARNEWSYQTAKEFYWAALTGNSEHFITWRVRDRDSFFCSSAEGKKNMMHEERNQFFAWTFQALGHLVHLIQDASVPAHTRNDIHGDWKAALVLSGVSIEPYEEWAYKNWENPDLMNYEGEGSDPWAKWMEYDLPAWNAFIDTEKGPIFQSEDLDQGLAEYSYGNFFSDDSMSSYELPLNNGTVFNETWTAGETEHTFIYLESANFRNGGVKHLALCGIIQKTPVTLLTYTTYLKTAFTVDTEKVHQDYASKLIPRAVGYSAGFFNYFFRGNFSVSEAFLERNEVGEITGLDLKAKNASKLDEGSSEIEPFGPGKIALCCKYMLPGAEEPVYSLVEDVYTIHNAGDAINSDYVPIHANFADPIPPKVTDLSFTLVFRGVLGREADAVAARAFKFTSRIAYQYQPGGSGTTSNIHTIRPDGTDEQNITQAQEPNPFYFSPKWSFDGRRLGFNWEFCRDPDQLPDGGCNLVYLDRQIWLVDPYSESLPYNLVSALPPFCNPDDLGCNQETGLKMFSFSPADSNRIVAIAYFSVHLTYLVVYNELGKKWEYIDGEEFDMVDGIWKKINGDEFWKFKNLYWRDEDSVEYCHVFSAPAWSPLGDVIAYYKHRDWDKIEKKSLIIDDIFLINPDIGREIRITNDAYLDIQPAWSPDGEQILFVSNRDGGDIMDIWIMDRTGENKRKILDCDSNCYSPCTSPDGKTIAFIKDQDIYTVNMDGQGLHRVTTGKGKSAPAWSPWIFEASAP